MNEKDLSKLCLCITLLSFLAIVPLGTSLFQEKSVADLLREDGTYGIIFGRVEHIISEGNNTLFIINDGNEAKVFYPKNLEIRKNDFVWIYGKGETYNREKEIHAFYVVLK